MVITYSAWEASKTGQQELFYFHSTGSINHKFMSEIIDSWTRHPKCVLITSTFNQSQAEIVLWQRPGYIDPCQAVG